MMKKIIFSVLFLSLAGCSSILPEGRPAPRLFTLNAPTMAPPQTTLPYNLQIVLPQTAPGLDTERIALKRTDNQVDYYADSRWAGALPQLLQAVLVDSFDHSGRYQSVSNDLTAINADYSLQIDARDFQAEYRDGEDAPTIHIRLVAKWVKANSKDVVAAQSYDQLLKSPSGSLADIVGTFDKTLKTAIGLMVDDTSKFIMPPELPAQTVSKKSK